jgi:4-hydroxyphenylpyruvate dioxygenase
MNYEKPTERPSIGKFNGFDHLVFWVGNAKQAAAYYTSRFGFEYLAYKGLETGERNVASHVIKRNRAIFEFQSSYDPKDGAGIGEHVKLHGDGVKDIAFEVEDCVHTFNVAKSRGAKVVREVETLSDENGVVIRASVQTYNETIHTFIERKNYKGVFLPGYRAHHNKEIFNQILPPVEFGFVDHVVGNQAVGDMEPTAQWYEKMLDFHRFWSVDDKIMHTEYSALNSIVVADFDEVIKMPLNEPAKGLRKSQIQEYVDYYNGAGVQHIALNTNDIISTITELRKRGVEFLEVPKAYYDNLRSVLPKLQIEVKEDIDTLEKLKILIDYDDKGYLLQLFTKPVEDRPTLFFEFIQRRNHWGFGAGNFKSLFKAIEDEQARRGNLI